MRATAITEAQRKQNRLPVGPGDGCCLTPSYSIVLRGGREIAVLLEVFFLRLVARRQLEQARRGAAQDVVLALLRHERQVVAGRSPSVDSPTSRAAAFPR